MVIWKMPGGETDTWSVSRGCFAMDGPNCALFDYCNRFPDGPPEWMPEERAEFLAKVAASESPTPEQP